MVVALVSEKYRHDDRVCNSRPNIVKSMTVMSILYRN